MAYLEEVYPKLKTAKACKTNKDNDTCIAFSIAMSIGKNWQFNPQLLSTSCTDFPQYLHHLACILHTTGKHYHIIKNKQVNHEDSVEMIKKWKRLRKNRRDNQIQVSWFWQAAVLVKCSNFVKESKTTMVIYCS